MKLHEEQKVGGQLGNSIAQGPPALFVVPYEGTIWGHLGECMAMSSLHMGAHQREVFFFFFLSVSVLSNESRWVTVSGSPGGRLGQDGG